MKRLITITLIVAFASTAFAAGKLVMEDSNRNVAIQGFAPDGAKDTTLTGNSQTINVSSDVAWSAYCAADGVYKNMSTATKRGINKTIPATTWHTRVVNPKSPFLNISCSGKLERQ